MADSSKSQKHDHPSPQRFIEGYQPFVRGYQPVAGPMTGTPTPPTGGSGIKPPPAPNTSNKS